MDGWLRLGDNPRAHPAKLEAWIGRFDPDQGVVFDLSVAADDPAPEELEAAVDAGTTPPEALNTYMHEEGYGVEAGSGLVVGTLEAPLDLARINERLFVANVDEVVPMDEAAFVYYSGELGEGGALVDNRIGFKAAEAGDGVYSIRWTARQVFLGDFTPVSIELNGARFQGLLRPLRWTPEEARRELAAYVTRFDRWSFCMSDGQGPFSKQGIFLPPP